jgi:hypothetical protein
MTTPDRLAERTQQPTPEAVTREMVRIRGIIEYTGTGDHEDLITYAKEVVRLRESLATPVPGAVSNAMVERPASVQAAFEVFEGKPDTGPHATALFRYVEELERALSSLAPVEAVATEPVALDGKGWVFWNPDSGEEYNPNHPVESGECDDAENIRKSTSTEDALWAGMQEEFKRANKAEAGLSAPTGDSGALREALADKCASDGCGRSATIHFIRGDIGSYYCEPCYLKIQATPASKGEPGK